MLNLFVMITLCCWGIWGILDKKALSTSTHLGVLARLFSMSLWQVPLFFIWMCVCHPGFHLSPELWLWTFLAAVARLISFTAYLIGMSLADASLVLGVTASYPVVTQLLAVSWLHESLVANRMFGALAIALGMLGIGGSHKGAASSESRKRLLMLWLSILAATVGWGVWGVFDKIAIDHATVYETWLAECSWEVVFFLVGALLWLPLRFKVELKDRPCWKYVFLSSLCLAVGKLAYLSALKLSSVSYVITITACYPVLMYALAVMMLRERFDLLRFAGIIIVVAGGIAVQLTQGS